jgi:50S ribosome-binding GTPase
VAFDLPGTTRDAISVPFERSGQQFELIDTAGLRRKGKVFEAIEKFSVVKTLQAIELANVVLLLLDATQGVTDQDAHIAGYILESGRAVVVAVNKWDAVDSYQRELLGVFKVCGAAFHIGKKTTGSGTLVGSRGASTQSGQLQNVHTRVDPFVAGSRAVPVTAARRHVSPQTALRTPGRHEPAGGGDPWQLAGTCDRFVQALPGRALSQRIQSGWHADAH